MGPLELHLLCHLVLETHEQLRLPRQEERELRGILEEIRPLPQLPRHRRAQRGGLLQLRRTDADGQRTDGEGGALGSLYRGSPEEPAGRGRRKVVRDTVPGDPQRLGARAGGHRLRGHGQPEGDALHVTLPHDDQPVGLYGRGQAVQGRGREHTPCQRLRQLHHLLGMGHLPRGASAAGTAETVKKHEHGEVDDTPPAAEHCGHAARMEPDGQRGVVHDGLPCRHGAGGRHREGCRHRPRRGDRRHDTDCHQPLLPQHHRLYGTGICALRHGRDGCLEHAGICLRRLGYLCGRQGGGQRARGRDLQAAGIELPQHLRPADRVCVASLPQRGVQERPGPLSDLRRGIHRGQLVELLVPCAARRIRDDGMHGR